MSLRRQCGILEGMERDERAEAQDLLRQEQPAEPAQLTRLLTLLLDDVATVPGTNVRFGVDPFLSLLPGGGSTIGTAVGVVVVADAIRLRAPIPVLLRMGFNHVIDWLIGLVPVLGVFGDVAWRANRRNMRLLNRTIAEREQVRKATVLYWITAIAILVGMVALVVGATLWLIFAIVGALQ